jgi:histidinol dehydrogenase
VLIVADDTADPALCAADLLAQAEHGPGSEAMLVTMSAELADDVRALVAGEVRVETAASLGEARFAAVR